jgi:hypothetical protein
MRTIIVSGGPSAAKLGQARSEPAAPAKDSVVRSGVAFESSAFAASLHQALSLSAKAPIRAGW